MRKIIPKLKHEHLVFKKGGIRPQLIDIKNKRMLLGEMNFYFRKLVFCITPSPDASASLLNAYEISNYVCKELGKKFYEDEFINYLKLKKKTFNKSSQGSIKFFFSIKFFRYIRSFTIYNKLLWKFS
jgi:L-2-hydroxyglutarate oxidase LhgO